MKIIIPMAGWGTRLRPHTLTVPKPMLPVAGKPIVHHLLNDLIKSSPVAVSDVIFIIRQDFGKAIEETLRNLANEMGVKGHIEYQDEPLGTAHAILCAGDFLEGNCIIAFADTLFKSDFKIDTDADGVIWVQRVDDPSAFGVVKLNEEGVIVDFKEKPKEFYSDLAIIGIYYVKDAKQLREAMQYLIDNNMREKGEYQLTNALENLKNSGVKFRPGRVDEWLDCGNKNATVDTNKRYLDILAESGDLPQYKNVSVVNSVVIQPCFLGEGASIHNSIIGPHVSIGSQTVIENSVVRSSIIQTKTTVQNKLIENSMIGSHVILRGNFEDLSVGDYIATK